MVSHGSFRAAIVAAGALVCGLAGCGGASSPDVDETGASSGDATSTPGDATGGGPTTASPPASSGTSEPTDSATGSTAGTLSTTTVTPTASTGIGGTETTTSEDELCSAGPSKLPEAVLIHHDQPLAPDGQTFIVECGGQGAFMFDFNLEVDGFAGEFVSFSISMDVEGFNVGPSGLFYEEEIADIYAGCDPRGGPYVNVDRLIIIPPDEIPDVSAMDGADVVFQFVLTTAFGDEISISSAGVVETDRSPQWNCCSGQGECPG